MEKIRSFLSVSIVTLLIFLLPTALLSRPFTDNGDGTVRAADTSLYWQRCAAGQSGADCSGDATRMQWQEARSYCSTLRLADRSWRLPTVAELLSLMEHGNDRGMRSAREAIAAFPGINRGYYWSSNETSTSGVYRTVRFYDVRGPVVNQSGPEYNRGEAWIRVRCLSDKSI